jgi:hypothetical protein
MNASGRLNTCKSRGIVAILETGARVRNAYAIYLLQRDSPEKFGLIPHSIATPHGDVIKVTTAKDEHASH